MNSYRNVFVLALAQGLAMIGTSTMIAEAALVGHSLADNPALATLPIALQQLFNTAAAFPASLLMGRIGRRAGFSIGAGFGFASAVVTTLGVFSGSFWTFTFGVALNGIYTGFANFYRFAAIEGAGAAKGKAVSYVLAGGLIAAIAGPELAKWTRDLWLPYQFAGSFASLGLVALLALTIIQGLNIPLPTRAESSGPARPLSEIVRQPVFIVAILGGMIAYGAMSLVMNATPLAMVACGLDLDQTAGVIQLHLVAMFGPAFFTGSFIQRFGVLRIMVLGAGLLLAAVAIDLAGITLLNFQIGLFALGLGWNFLFVGATTLVTEAYRPAEKAKVQAANDALVFGSVSLSAFVAGLLHHAAGWNWVNLAPLPFLLLTLLASLWLMRRRAA